jgi:hypothetical protein
MLNDLANLALSAVVRVMGEPITYHRGGDSWEAKGAYQASYVGLDPETGVQVRSTQPVLLVNERDLPVQPKAGDRVDVRGKTYLIRDPQPDGHTGWLLMLHRTSNR